MSSRLRPHDAAGRVSLCSKASYMLRRMHEPQVNDTDRTDAVSNLPIIAAIVASAQFDVRDRHSQPCKQSQTHVTKTKDFGTRRISGTR